MFHDMPVVFIVDDDISVRESLEALISLSGWQARTFSSADAFLARSERASVPGCIVLDVSMPGLDGLELQRQIASDSTVLPIIFITGYGDVPTTVQAMKAGAFEFLMKPFCDEAILHAIEHAVDRSRSALERAEELKSLRDVHASLSRREREVMALVITGLMNKQIGFELGISEITVKAHRGRMMHKMNARSVPDLVNMNAKLDAAAAVKS